jgi:anti-anti-sigma regulatory factor
MKYTFEEMGHLGIYKFQGELTSECERDLLLILMRAFYKYEQIVIDFHNVKKIDHVCVRLLNKAYLTSKRFKRPFILNGIKFDQYH